MRKALFWTHLAVGVSAGLVILSMCVTGMVLAFEPQITAYADRGIRSVPLPDPPVRRWDIETLLARAAETSSAASPTFVTLESNPSSSAQVRLGKEGSVYLNPYTGAVLGNESYIHFWLQDVEEWHRWLGSKEIGKPITGAAALAFMGLAFSGVFLWWPAGSLQFRFGLKGKAKNWNRHTTAGFWCSLYILLLTSTGALMSYSWANSLLFRAAGAPLPARAAVRPAAVGEKREGRPPVPSFAGLNPLWTRAEKQVPGWLSLTLRIPPKPDVPVDFFILDPSIGRAHARSQLTLDRRSGEIVKWEPYAGYNRGQKWKSWVTPLHTGRAWGWVGQSVNFVVAGGGLVLVWTGLAMALRRFRDYVRKS